MLQGKLWKAGVRCQDEIPNVLDEYPWNALEDQFSSNAGASKLVLAGK